MILDWFARCFVEMNLTFHLVNMFPIPDSDPFIPGSIAEKVAHISGRLATTIPDDRFVEWADEVGVPVGSVKSETEKQDLIHELDACVAHLYGLDEDDLEVLYETFHTNTDYSEHHAAVLEHFRRLT